MSSPPEVFIGLTRFHPAGSRHNSRFYAIKVMNKKKIVLAKEELCVCSEQSVLQAVRHPFIVNLWAAFQDSENLYMVMDFVRGGELSTLLRRAAVSRYTCLIFSNLISLNHSVSPIP